MTDTTKMYLFDPSDRTEAGGYPVYVGYEDAEGALTHTEVLCPSRSQALVNHSPNGFSWGYSGSGPAQCALGVLLDVTDDENVAMRWYQSFKSEVIAHMPQDKKLQIPVTAIREWLKEKQSV